MDERITFIVASVAAEISASVLFYLCFPASPLTAASPDLLSYAGQHGALAITVWALLLAGAWFALGQQLTRLRQNLSSKLGVLLRLGMIGILITGAVSLYQLSAAPDPVNARVTSGPMILSLLVQTVIYAGTFAGLVFVAYVVGRTRKPLVTPPPRFGRE